MSGPPLFFRVALNIINFPLAFILVLDAVDDDMWNSQPVGEVTDSCEPDACFFRVEHLEHLYVFSCHWQTEDVRCCIVLQEAPGRLIGL